MWKIDNVGSEYYDSFVEPPFSSRVEHSGKVRDLKVNLNNNYFVSLGTEGTLLFWDSTRFEPISTVDLEHSEEVVCIADDGNSTVAVGSQSNVTIVDKKSNKIECTLDSPDLNWGVRSVNFHHNLITIGGGAGRVSFYERRKNVWLSTVKANTNEEIPLVLDTGVRTDEPRHAGFNSLPDAVYTHKFDPSGTRMFIGGGPLLNGFKGCYCAFWV